jgi:hypothetical protein
MIRLHRARRFRSCTSTLRLFRTQARRVQSASVMNLTISNVAGPRERGHIEGATISEIYSEKNAFAISMRILKAAGRDIAIRHEK